MKKLLVTGIVLACIWLSYQYPHVMLNPGELTGGHSKIKDQCNSCHNPFWGISSDKCIGCHKLSDIGKDTTTAAGMSVFKDSILFHSMLEGQACTSCHTDHKGIKQDMSVKKFTHDLLPEAVISKCSSCHRRPSDKLHLQVSSSCNSCHNTNGWKAGVVFNHEMIQGVDKNNCTGCHQKPNDDYHGAFRDNCDKCHSMEKWVPSTFDHSTYFRLDQAHNVKCLICHINTNFKAYTCYGCHEHSEGKLMDEHNEHGIYNFDKCISCHKSGNKHDAEGEGRSEGEGKRHHDGENGGDD